jgi:hypothetical protein
VIARLLRLLCSVGIHHVPEERRRVTNLGWYGTCTRCGAECDGQAGIP